MGIETRPGGESIQSVWLRILPDDEERQFNTPCDRPLNYSEGWPYMLFRNISNSWTVRLP